METIVYAARLKDHKLLKESSSGGIYIALANHYIESGNAVVSSVYDYEKKELSFKLMTSVEQCKNARGSKYFQSDSSNIYNVAFNWLEENQEKKLIFFGTGCQAAGFIEFAKAKGISNRLVVVDIICHGGASPKIWSDYAASLEKKYSGEITYITFKDKRNGWKTPTAYAVINGKEILIKDYVRLFYSRCILRPSCHICPYATVERDSDVTIGDFWGIDQVMPAFYSFDGTSLVLIHSQKGKNLFKEIMPVLDYKQSSVNDCLQPNLVVPTPKNKKRDVFWIDYKRKGIDFIIKKYGSIDVCSRVKSKFHKVKSKLMKPFYK